MVGRLKPGVTPAQAQQDAAAAAREIMRNFPPALSRRRIHPLVQPLDEATVAQARPLVRTLFLAVMVVLFIACANLAGLLLVRVIRPAARNFRAPGAGRERRRRFCVNPWSRSCCSASGSGLMGLALAG